MKILLLNKWFVTGGIERCLLSYLKIFDQLGYQVVVLSHYDVSYAEKNFHNELVQYSENIRFAFSCEQKETQSYFHKIEKRRTSIINRLSYRLEKWRIKRKCKAKMLETLEREKFDFVIDFSGVLNLSILNSVKQYSVPLIKWVHSQTDINHRQKNKKWQKFKNLYQEFDYVVPVSAQMGEEIKVLFNINNVYAIPNPIDIKDIQYKSTQRINFPVMDFFLVVARLVKGKGLEELIDIYAKLKQCGVKNKLFIIGDGELREILQEKIRQNNLEQDCCLLGEMTNPYPYFKQAKLFLFTSESEGLPVVLVESIVSGTPIIAMDCPTGPRDIIGNKNEYGKLIPLHHQEKFIQATLELLENEDLYQNYVQQSLIRSKDFSLEHISQKVQCLFEKIKK